MGAHSLGQFNHFNVATRTRMQMEMDAEDRRRAYIKRKRKQLEDQKPAVTVVEAPVRWWRRLWSWMKRTLSIESE